MPTDPEHRAEVPAQRLLPQCGVSGPATAGTVTGSSRYPCRLRKASNAGLSLSLWWGQGIAHRHRHQHHPGVCSPSPASILAPSRPPPSHTGPHPMPAPIPRWPQPVLPILRQGSLGTTRPRGWAATHTRACGGARKLAGADPLPGWAGAWTPRTLSRERGTGRAPAAKAQGRLRDQRRVLEPFGEAPPPPQWRSQGRGAGRTPRQDPQAGGSRSPKQHPWCCKGELARQRG